MGYYKERIKGSNLERQRNRFSWAVALTSTVIGLIIYYNPGPSMKRAFKEGWFDEPEWHAYKAAYWRKQFEDNSFTPLTREEFMKLKKDKDDATFPPNILNKENLYQPSPPTK